MERGSNCTNLLSNYRYQYPKSRICVETSLFDCLSISMSSLPGDTCTDCYTTCACETDSTMICQPLGRHGSPRNQVRPRSLSLPNNAWRNDAEWYVTIHIVALASVNYWNDHSSIVLEYSSNEGRNAQWVSKHLKTPNSGSSCHFSSCYDGPRKSSSATWTPTAHFLLISHDLTEHPGGISNSTQNNTHPLMSLFAYTDIDNQFA